MMLGRLYGLGSGRLICEAQMNLLADTERVQLLDNGVSAARREHLDSPPVVKLYTPDAHAVWLLTELDPADSDTAYGLCDAGIGWPDLGQIRLSDLEDIRGPKGMQVARDPYFTSKHSPSECFRRAKAVGSIND